MSTVAVSSVIVSPAEGWNSSAVKVSVNSALSSVWVCTGMNAMVLLVGSKVIVLCSAV